MLIAELPLSAVTSIDRDAALMDSSIDHEHFLGTWERFLIPSILSCFTSSNGAGASLSQLRLGVRLCWVGWEGRCDSSVTAPAVLGVEVPSQG